MHTVKSACRRQNLFAYGMQIALSAIFACLMSVAWSFVPTDADLGATARLIVEFRAAFTPSLRTIGLFVLICALFIVYKRISLNGLGHRGYIFASIVAVILACAWSLGMLYYAASGEWNGCRIVRAFILFLSYSFVFYRMAVVAFCAEPAKPFTCFYQYHPTTIRTTNGIAVWCQRHSFVVAWVIIFACWLPYALALYPGITSPNDTLDSLQQFVGVESFTSTMAGQLVEGLYLNNHHPVIYTVLLGVFFSMGAALGSANMGMFALVLLQGGVLAGSLASVACAVNRLQTRMWYWVTIALFALVPVFPLLAFVLTKDILFTASFIAFVLLLERLLVERAFPRHGWEVVGVAACLLLSVLLRSTMLYVAVAWVFCVFLYLWKHSRRILAGVGAGLATALFVLWAVYPMLGIAPGSSGEALAVAYNQVARCYLEHGEELDAADIQTIDDVLSADSLAGRYCFTNADPVKNNRNFLATSDETASFLKLWLKLGVRYPSTYLEALSGTCSGYYSPIVREGFVWTFSFGWRDGSDPNLVIDQSGEYDDIGFFVSQEGASYEARDALSEAFEVLQASPIGLLWDMGIYFFVLILGIARCLFRYRMREVVVLAIVFILSATFLFSPINSLLRYFLPCFSLVPVVLAMAFGRTSCETETAASSLLA